MKKTKRTLTKTYQLFSMATLPLISACEGLTDGVSNLVDVGGACYSQTYRQASYANTNKLDILIVGDTSSSLDDEHQKIAANLDRFVAQLPAGIDFRLAFMPAHGSTSSYSGRLYKESGGTWVLDSKQLSVAQIQDRLKNKFLNAPSDYGSDGGEEGMYSLTRALETTQLTESRGRGFFRTDAALAVLFIADENDICAQYPAGVVPVADPGGAEIRAKARDCSQITPTSVLSRLKELQGDRPLVVAGLIYNNLATVPHNGENEFGYGYDELIKAADGVSADLADSNFDASLSTIGTFTSERLQAQTVFTLAKTNIDTSKITVYVDSVSTEFTYNSTSNQVAASNGGGASSVVQINYCTNTIEPSTSPSPIPTCSGISCGILGS